MVHHHLFARTRAAVGVAEAKPVSGAWRESTVLGGQA